MRVISKNENHIFLKNYKLKVLVVRFSSIGDIVLTTPVLRCLKTQLNNVEIHYITKQKFATVIEHNPYIDKLITIKNNVSEIITELKKENYDYVIDLHHNLRTLNLKKALNTKSFSYNKLNWQKFLIVNFKINQLPKHHIVDRYLDTIQSLGVKNDNKGLEYFISENDAVDVKTLLPMSFQNGFNTLVIGGSYFTKQIPLNKLQEICTKSKLPLVILGGKEDAELGKKLTEQFPQHTYNTAGTLTINQSASIIKQCEKVITSDTGLMHIAAAYKKNIFSLWGNTIPEFGMSPYLAGENSIILEVKDLSCRPCSKLGYKKCPKGHFKCMNNIDITSSKF